MCLGYVTLRGPSGAAYPLEDLIKDGRITTASKFEEATSLVALGFNLTIGFPLYSLAWFVVQIMNKVLPNRPSSILQTETSGFRLDKTSYIGRFMRDVLGSGSFFWNGELAKQFY